MARRGENIYKRKDGRWEGRYKSGVKADGRTKYSSVYGKSYADVKALLAEKRIKSVDISIPKNLTLNDLFDIWFSDICLKVKASTYTAYQMKYNKHIRPALGGAAYDKLTADNLNSFVQGKLVSGLSPKYTSDIASVIKAICRFAKRRFGYEDKSEYIVMPKGTAKEKALLDRTEQTRLNKYLLSNPTLSNVGILLCSATGIRIGELCALRWENINLEKRTLTVNSTVQRIKNIGGDTATKLSITSPKSKSSIREILLPDFIIPILAENKADSSAYLLSGTKKIIEPRTMQYRFKRILAELKLSDVSYHSLRHFYATALINVGVDPATVSGALGHSLVSTTTSIYCHVFQEAQAKAGDAIASVLDFSKKKQDEERPNEQSEAAQPTA